MKVFFPAAFLTGLIGLLLFGFCSNNEEVDPTNTITSSSVPLLTTIPDIASAQVNLSDVMNYAVDVAGGTASVKEYPVLANNQVSITITHVSTNVNGEAFTIKYADLYVFTDPLYDRSWLETELATGTYGWQDLANEAYRAQVTNTDFLRFSNFNNVATPDENLSGLPTTTSLAVLVLKASGADPFMDFLILLDVHI